MRRRSKALAAFTAAVFLALIPLPAGGQQADIGLAPAIGIRSTIPGRAVEEQLTVVNLSEDDFSVSASVNDLVVNDNGSFSSAPAGSGLPSASAWGLVDPTNFVLPRGHSRTVRVAFAPPAATKPQGYYSAVEFTTVRAGGGTSRVIHPVLLAVEGTELLRAAKIVSVQTPSRSVGSSVPVTLRLESSGNVYAVAIGTITVRDSLSRVTAVVPISRTPVIPGAPRVLRVEIPAPIVPGPTRITASLGFGSGVPTDVATATVFAIAWWHVGVAAAVLLIVIRILIGWIRRRRRRRLMKRLAAQPVPEPPVGAPPVAREGAGRAAAVPGVGDLQTRWDTEAPPPPRPLEPKPIPSRRSQITEVPPAAIDEPEPAPPPPAPEPEPAREDEVVSLFEPMPGEAAPMDVEELPVHEEPVVEKPVVEELVVVERPAPKPAAVVPAAPPVVVEPPAPEPAPVVIEWPAPEPVPLAPAEPVVPVPVPAMATLHEEVLEEAAGEDVVARMADRVKAGIPAEPPPGSESAARRAAVAVEVLARGKGRSQERVDVGIQLLKAAGTAEAARAVEEAFDEAVAADRKGALAGLALALNALDHPRATEALLRAYAASPRGLLVRLRKALEVASAAELGAQKDLIAALPADRRSALRVD